MLGMKMRHCNGIVWTVALIILLTVGENVWAVNVTVVGLFPGKAVVVINGASARTISVGQKQPEDVTLVSTASTSAVFNIEGKRHTLDLGEYFAVAGGSDNASTGKSLTLSADTGGQFWTIGQINGKSIRFLIDTGATLIALPAGAATGMGIDYTKGKRGFAATAGGVVPVHRILLDTVTVGTITLYQIEATIFENGLDVALLGMSFLNRVDMKREGAYMTLVKRF